MGKLIVNGNEYLINTSASDKHIDNVCASILNNYPPDATVDFIELF